MSALCAYTRYIACIGLFKHCKRIHSTESYFQKVALCIILIYIFIFSPSPSTVAVAYQYVSAGSWSLLFLFVFRKHGRPCDTTWPGIDKRLTNAVARQTHPYQRRGWTQLCVCVRRTLQVARTTARGLIGWVTRASRVQKTAAGNQKATVAPGVPPVDGRGAVSVLPRN